MNKPILSLNQIRPNDVKLVGRKTANLSRLVRAGYPVPPGLCVTTSAFWLALGARRDQIAGIVAEHDLRDPAKAQTASAHVADILSDVRVPPHVLSALESMMDSQMAMAVR